MNEAELFADALEVTDPHERSALLDRPCAGNAVLRPRSGRGLELHEANVRFLEP